MEYPFRYDDPKIGDKCWFVSQSGVHEARIMDKHDHYYNVPNRVSTDLQKDFSIDYWIDLYEYHALIFGEDLFLTQVEAEEVFNSPSPEKIHSYLETI